MQCACRHLTRLVIYCGVPIRRQFGDERSCHGHRQIETNDPYETFAA
jgi:hypothetical protein